MATKASDEQPRCMFWRLPLEMRDMIYDLVYGEMRQIRVETRSNWLQHEQFLKNSSRTRHVVGQTRFR